MEYIEIQTKPRQTVSPKSAMAKNVGKIRKTQKSAIQTKARQRPDNAQTTESANI